MIMISKNIKYFCKDYTKIENYDKAINDETQVWVCHHRLETCKYKDRNRKEWIRRDENIPMRVLKFLGLYYDRPPEELIFMTNDEHTTHHLIGHEVSEETREKLRKFNLGKKHTEETKRKLSEMFKGVKKPPRTEEWKRKQSLARKGKPNLKNRGRKGYTPWNKGIPCSEEAKRKNSEAHKGKRWYNNGTTSILTRECPEGFKLGRLPWINK